MCNSSLSKPDLDFDLFDHEAGVLRRAESPLNRVASPAEVADAVVYLASRQAQLVSGSILDLNGASYLRM